MSTFSNDEFFTSQTIQSLTKARIVTKYFVAWSNILGKRARNRNETIRYVDLFAGRGCYKDGSPSTPLLILKHVIDTPELHDLFISQFNDAEHETALALELAIRELEHIDMLKYKPRICCTVVDDRIAEWFESKNYVATLTFIDPFGFAGVSARLIQATLKDEGSECIFFFNFNRVNAAIDNACVEEHVKRLFDTIDAAALRDEFKGMNSFQREEAVVKKLSEVIKRKHAQYVLQFRFLNDEANRTSHYLVFATKKPLGAKIMKDIMAKESSWFESGSPGYGYSPKPKEASIFDYIDPVPLLAEELVTAFMGQTLTVAEVYFQHGLERPETPSQYKEALKLLESEKKISAKPPASERRDDTMADHIAIQFPPKKV